MVGFISRNLERGVCPQCVQEMTGIMDGCEMRFKQFIDTHIAMQEKLANAAASAAANGGKAAAGGGSSSKGARLIPGGSPDSEDKPAGKSDSGLRVASNMQQAQAGIQGLRDDMKKGYQLYDDQQYAPIHDVLRLRAVAHVMQCLDCSSMPAFLLGPPVLAIYTRLRQHAQVHEAQAVSIAPDPLFAACCVGVSGKIRGGQCKTAHLQRGVPAAAAGTPTHAPAQLRRCGTVLPMPGPHHQLLAKRCRAGAGWTPGSSTSGGC